MAGDWLKWIKGLSKKQEVIKMAGILGIDRFSVASRCMSVWEWADDEVPEESIRQNGSAVIKMSPRDGDNIAFIDDVAGVTGFAEAMCDAGWLSIQSGFIEFPNFDIHNGETAKTRARNSKNQKGKRSKDAAKNTPQNTSCHHDAVTNVTGERTQMSPANGDISVTREEKRIYINPHTPLNPDEFHRLESELIAAWNTSEGVKPYGRNVLSEKLRRDLIRRLEDQPWDWVAALLKFPLNCGTEMVLSKFLEDGVVQDIIDGKYDWTKNDPTKPVKQRNMTPEEDAEWRP